MKSQKFFIIAVLITIILVLIFFFKNNNYSDKKENIKLFTTLNDKIDNISKIEINNAESSLFLLKKDDLWYLPSFNGYPASNKKINNFLLNLVSLKTLDKKTNNPINHQKLGLALPVKGFSNRFRIFDNNKELLADFLIGNKSKQNEELSYIRNLDSNDTWLFRNNLGFYNTELNWSEESILRIARWRVKSIKIENLDKTDKNIFISKKKYSDQMYTLKDLPNEFELASIYSISSYASLLESLKKNDIKPFTKELKAIKKIKYQTFDGLDISIILFDIDGSLYSHFTVYSDTSIRKELPESEPLVVGLPDMKSYIDVKKEVDRYNYLSNWLYKLNDDVYKEFLKPYSELIKKKETKSN